MASDIQAQLTLSAVDDPSRVGTALVAVRRGYHEEPAAGLAVASTAYEAGRARDDAVIRARARGLQAAITLHRGDLGGALSLVLAAERDAQDSGDPGARAEVAAVHAQVSFFAGSYAEALGYAELALSLADQAGDPGLDIYVRRVTCPVLGNIGVSDLGERLEATLALTIAAGDPWEEAVSRNDLACYRLEQGDVSAAQAEIERALATAGEVPGVRDFVRGLVLSTRADIELAAGRSPQALSDAREAIALLTVGGDPNPYVLGVTIRAEIQARMALGELDDARAFGEQALAWLGDRVPQTRSLILTTLADELRRAGRLEEAYATLARAAELERQAFRELSALQAAVERAALETDAARRERDALATRHRELAESHADLVTRTAQLEALQEQLIEQADRDWLTGLHNRRYLARELEPAQPERLAPPFTVAVLDLDRFKSVNDRFGHGVGDQVLVRVAGLLCEVLREHDIVVRNGGEEFLVVMPGTDERAGASACERIRRTIEHEPWYRIAPGLAVTTSVGAAFSERADEVDALAGVADRRLYEAKRQGRNRVVGPSGDEKPAPHLARARADRSD